MSSEILNVVSVAFPIAVPGLYDYLIPPELKSRVMPGMPVLVDLKNRSIWGVAVQLKASSTFPHLKQVQDVASGRWTAGDRSLIGLYEWIAAYYQTELSALFKPFIKRHLTKASAKTMTVYYCASSPQEEAIAGLTARQLLVYETIKKSCDAQKAASGHAALPSTTLTEGFGVSSHMLAMLTQKGIIVKEERIVLREADELNFQAQNTSVLLSEEQQQAVEVMQKEMQSSCRPCLLHGITGSGKTFVYIELAKAALASGKGVIILVPEISLTPQTIRRFREALGPVMTVIHSRMSEGERRDSLEELVTGRKRVVVGVRSAILAPMENIGLIIVDEEHDASYKQSDSDPRFNARDVAIMRAHFQKTLVVLGSATPSFESYRNALIGKYLLVSISRRFGVARLPNVEIVDMGEEHRDNNWTLLSRELHRRIVETLEAKRQVILLLNRRGFSTFLICKNCGHTYACPNCSVNLTYHKTTFDLKCHTCGFSEPAPQTCPKCRGEQIKFKGTGIQKAEEYLREQFPQCRILRMDQDTTRRKGAHVDLLERFAKKEADILLGTQMVAKGLNFPGVALVGVLQADIGLHFPDFRATEKTFQLLSQVAGRAGREDSSGEVIIQTYFPRDVGILAAKDHDFIGFFNQEIVQREQLGYPPFGKLMRILVVGEAEPAVQSAIMEIARMIKKHFSGQCALLGPAPAVFSRMKNNFRYSMLLKSKSVKALREIGNLVRKGMPRPAKGVKVIIDVDPINML
jgi:primosomal protein N' (replication factor Y) (superfamily II helicase)